AGQVVLGGTRHFSMMDGEWHPSMSDKFAMVAVEPGDYFAGGHHHRFPTVELREKPQNLLPKPAPSPLGYVRFASEMWSEPYVYTETVDYYKPVITGFVGTVAISEDMYMGTRNYAATGYRKAIPTVTENLETTLLNGGLIQTLKVSAKAGEILVLPEMFLDTTTGYRYHANSCSDEGRREWICPVGAIPYLFKRADVKGFLDTLKYNGILNPWSTVVKEAPLTHNDQLKSTGFFRDGYAIYVLGEIPPELQPAKPVQRDGVAPAPKPKAAPKAKK
ncbi:MAG TPA: hypothetical protein VFV57_03680, partial [Limnobacter sp.]|nr:hypothetical protein [Limnobacter sp.]